MEQPDTQPLRVSVTFSERLNDLALAITFNAAKLDNAPSVDSIARGITQIAHELEALSTQDDEPSMGYEMGEDAR